MSGDLPETLPPMRRYGQDYGPFNMDAEAGYERGGAYVEQGAADPGGESTPYQPEDCPFGEIITWSAGDPPAIVTGIRGGVIHCGDQNWNIDPDEIDLEIDGVWLVSIEVECEANRDDDGELLLPGVKTGTKPASWTRTVWAWGTDYPDNTPPAAVDGLGAVVLPIGKLTVAGGSATLEPVGCGHITVTHCAGTLGYTRE